MRPGRLEIIRHIDQHVGVHLDPMEMLGELGLAHLADIDGSDARRCHVPHQLIGKRIGALRRAERKDAAKRVQLLLRHDAKIRSRRS